MLKVKRSQNNCKEACGRAAAQVENVEVLEDNHIKFDFLGKDSIRYENEVAVHPKVHSLVRQFCKTTKDNKGEPPPSLSCTLAVQVSCMLFGSRLCKPVQSTPAAWMCSLGAAL